MNVIERIHVQSRLKARFGETAEVLSLKY